MNNTLSSFISAIHVLDEIDIIEIGVIKEQRRQGVAYKLFPAFKTLYKERHSKNF